MAEQSTEYEVLRPVVIDGRRRPKGELVHLHPLQAAAWAAAGKLRRLPPPAAEAAKPKKKPSTKSKES